MDKFRMGGGLFKIDKFSQDFLRMTNLESLDILRVTNLVRTF